MSQQFYPKSKMINKRKQYISSLSIIESSYNINNNLKDINDNDSPLKQKYKKAQLNNVYQQLRNNFDKQASKIKLENLSKNNDIVFKELKEINTKNKINKAFDDQGLSSTNFIKKQKSFSSSKNNNRSKFTLPKFYAQNILAQDSVYIHQKKQIDNFQVLSDFKKLSFPKATLGGVNNNANRSQRNKKILNLCKKASLQQTLNKNYQINNPQFSTNKISSPLNPRKSSINTVGLQPLLKKRLQFTMEEVLRIAQKKRQNEKNIALNFHSNSNLLININTLQHENLQILQNYQSFDKAIQDSELRLKMEEKFQYLRSPSTIINNDKKVSPYSQRAGYKSLKVKKRTFNWKSAHFPLNKIQKIQLAKLFQRYLEIQDVIVPHLGFYKVYIGQGNNSVLFWRTLKAKGFWTLVDSLDQNPNLVWTQAPIKKIKSIITQKFQIQANSEKQADILFPSIKAQNENIQISQQQINSFLKIKNNQYFETIRKVYGPKQIFKLQSEIISKFKNEKKVSQYDKLWESIKKYLNFDGLQYLKANQVHIHNHISNSQCIGDKKNLFYYMKQYAKIFGEDINQYIPETVHLDAPTSDQQINKNKKLVLDFIPEGPWLVKPGQSSNRGNGITIHTSSQTMLNQISRKKTHKNGQDQTYIVQKYIMPMLYNERKFDIRVWVLWTGNQLWWYDQGYLRTASKQFSLKSLNKYIHLTNDAVQNTCQDYGKFQPGNKLSFSQFERYLQLKQLKQVKGSQTSSYQIGHQIKANSNNTFKKYIYPKMKQLATKVFRIGSTVMDNSKHSFELFGLDYLIDTNNKVWLIQVNSNPSLQICSSLLARLIPNMLDNLTHIVIDPYFPPPQKKSHKDVGLFNPQSFHFELLYDCRTDHEINQYLKNKEAKFKPFSFQRS